MSSAELKLDLHKMIDSIQDKTVLGAIYAFLFGNKDLPKSDWASSLSEKDVEDILRGLKDEENGNVISHEEMLEKHRKQFPHLGL